MPKIVQGGLIKKSSYVLIFHIFASHRRHPLSLATVPLSHVILCSTIIDLCSIVPIVSAAVGLSPCCSRLRLCKHPCFCWRPYCVGGPVVAFIPAVPCFSAVVSGHDDVVILNVACCWRYCCCLSHCYCWHPDRGTHPCCCWCSLSSLWFLVASLFVIADVPGVAKVLGFLLFLSNMLLLAVLLLLAFLLLRAFLLLLVSLLILVLIF